MCVLCICCVARIAWCVAACARALFLYAYPVVFARTTSQGLADIEAAAALLASSHIDPAAAAAGPSGRLHQLQHQVTMSLVATVISRDAVRTS